jgi:NADPH:quinone reductase-like Zn-dependent oxidoreductase
VKNTRIIVTHYGGPDALRILVEKCPEPKRGEVRVRVLAAGVSLPDVMAREGIHPETPKVPFTPGWDLVGVVERVGDGVTGVEVGQKKQRLRTGVITHHKQQASENDDAVQHLRNSCLFITLKQ